MKQIKILPKSEFAKNVITLMTGSGIAQVIPVLASLVLARLYSPQDFGVLALYTSIIAILGNIGAWRYEVAIVLPKEDKEARNLLLLSAGVLLSMTFIYLIISIIFDDSIVTLIKKKTDTIDWRYFIVLGVFIYTSYQILNFWTNRKIRYKQLAISRVVQSSTTSLSNVLFGVFGVGAIGLVLGTILGQFVSNFYLFSNIRKKDFPLFRGITKRTLLVAGRNYNQFPKYATPSTLFNTISNMGLPVLITMFYDAKIAGLYFFAMRIIRLPLDFMFSSFAQVYREKAADLYNNDRGRLLEITKEIQLKLILVMLPILTMISVLAPVLFSFVFGSEWREAGEYVRYFVVFIFLSGIYSPISSIGDVLMEQRAILIFNITLSFTQFGILFIMNKYFDFKTVILTVSVVCGFYYIILDRYMKIVLKKNIISY